MSPLMIPRELSVCFFYTLTSGNHLITPYLASFSGTISIFFFHSLQSSIPLRLFVKVNDTATSLYSALNLLFYLWPLFSKTFSHHLCRVPWQAIRMPQGTKQPLCSHDVYVLVEKLNVKQMITKYSCDNALERTGHSAKSISQWGVSSREKEAPM